MTNRRAGPIVTNSAADRAGDTVRRYLRDETSREIAIAAVSVIGDYRDMHAYPMTKVTVGVRSMIRTEMRNDMIRPGQRFKRMDRILGKLARFPMMRLSQMEDIGGCRAVLPGVPEVYEVARRIMRKWRDTAKMTDYIAEPKPDGYRGIHIVERRDGRLIEVQLRTQGQHEWAETVEVWGSRLGFDIKGGSGPDDLRTYFERAAYRIALQEQGEPADDDLEAEFATLRRRVLPYFQRDT